MQGKAARRRAPDSNLKRACYYKAAAEVACSLAAEAGSGVLGVRAWVPINAVSRRWQSRTASADAGMLQASKVCASACQAASRSSRSRSRLGIRLSRWEFAIYGRTQCVDARSL